jgi:hypothetical protein
MLLMFVVLMVLMGLQLHTCCVGGGCMYLQQGGLLPASAGVAWVLGRTVDM